MTTSRLRQKLARTESSTLIVRARKLAAGFSAGTHRAEKKGSGVEFAGHRAYTPGDDLRHLDRHAWLRHQRLLVRESFSDTDRSVHLIVDATSSMDYAGHGAATHPRKIDMAILLAATLGFVSQTKGDRVGLTTVTDAAPVTAKPAGGREHFERILSDLERLDEGSHRSRKETAVSRTRADWRALFHTLGTLLPRGTLVFVLSDYLDFTESDARDLASLGTHRRTIRAAQILTQSEIDFPFEGSIRLRNPETGQEVETEASSVRRDYKRALADLTETLTRAIERQAGSFLRISTADSPEHCLRTLALGPVSAPRRAR